MVPTVVGMVVSFDVRGYCHKDINCNVVLAVNGELS